MSVVEKLNKSRAGGCRTTVVVKQILSDIKLNKFKFNVTRWTVTSQQEGS